MAPAQTRTYAHRPRARGAADRGDCGGKRRLCGPKLPPTLKTGEALCPAPRTGHSLPAGRRRPTVDPSPTVTPRDENRRRPPGRVQRHRTAGRGPRWPTYFAVLATLPPGANPCRLSQTFYPSTACLLLPPRVPRLACTSPRAWGDLVCDSSYFPARGSVNPREAPPVCGRRGKILQSRAESQ